MSDDMSDTPHTQPVEPHSGLAEEPERIGFTEVALPGEPDGDRKLVLDDGLAIRERLVLSDERSDGVKTGAENPVATAFTISISAALLDEHDRVVRRDGKPVIANAHELVLTNEALGRLGSEEAVDAAIRDARQVAAARASLEFRGAMLAESLLSDRLKPEQQ